MVEATTVLFLTDLEAKVKDVPPSRGQQAVLTIQNLKKKGIF